MTTAAAAAAPGHQDLNPGLVLAASILATGATALDLTIGTVALPHMRGTFSATPDQISWVVTSYIVATAIMMPATGWLSNRFGRRRVFLTAITGFTMASVLCGLATSLPQEVAARALQGAFGAPLVPISQMLILESYPKEKQGKALSYWGLGVMLGPVVGPTLGGYLTETYSWPWIYYINVPIGIAAAAAAFAGMPKDRPGQGVRFDWSGFGFLAVSVTCVQLILDRGERQDWFDSTEIIVEAVVAALTLYLFLVQITTARQPFLSRDLFRDRNYAVGTVLIFMFGFVLLPPLVLIPIFLQELKDYPVLTVGWVLSPRSLGVMAGMLIGGRLIGRVDPRWVFSVGLVLVAISGWDMSRWTLSVSRDHIVSTGAVQGLGMGLTYGPLFYLAFLTLPDRLRGEATGFFQLMRNIGSSVAVAIFVFMVFRNTTINRSELIQLITPFNQQLTGSGARWNIDSLAGLLALDQEITRQAAMIAYNNDYLILTATALAMIPLAFLFRIRMPDGA